MFIYKITIKSTNQSYIGFDTSKEYKKSRWKSHCRQAKSGSLLKVHVAMREQGIENCTYEVIARDFTSVCSLALEEIRLIELHNTYENGLNSTRGGDGLGIHDLHMMSDEEIEIVKKALSESFTTYNNKKWKNTTIEERSQLTEHLHNQDIYARRAKTLKDYYDTVDGARERHSAGLDRWRKENAEKHKCNRLKATAACEIPVTVEREDTKEIEVYKSQIDFKRKTGIDFRTMRDNMRKYEYYRGYKLKENG